MAKVLVFLLPALYGLVAYRISAWRTRRDLDSRSSPLANPQLQPGLDRLARASGLDEIPVNVYDIGEINGLADADGRIFLTRGFLERMQAGEFTPAELCTVIAHELGHVALGHSRKRIAVFAAQNALRPVLQLTLGRFLPLVGRGIVDFMAPYLARLVASGVSRQDEYEADLYAAALLVKSGLGIAPQISLFRKLETASRARPGIEPEWLASHPRLESRIARLEETRERWNQIPQPS